MSCSTQEWKQRAMAALDLSNKSKAMAVAWCKLLFLRNLLRQGSRLRPTPKSDSARGIMWCVRVVEVPPCRADGCVGGIGLFRASGARARPR